MPMNLQYEGDEGSNIWFPMTEGENWLQPRGRRVERVTYGGEPREVRHTHVDVNREIVPVNLAEHSGSLYDDLHHEEYFPHDEHEQVHTFFEDLSDFFPNGERQFPMPMNLQYEGDEGSNIWFPMTEGENWLQPRGRRVERVTYGGQPREVRHTHVDVNREIVPVNLAQDEVFVEHGDHLHGSGGSYIEIADDSNFHRPQETEDEVFVEHDEHHSHGSAGTIAEHTVNLYEHPGSLYEDLHHEEYFPHDEHEQVHTFFEDLSDFFPNGERQFPMPMNLQYEGDEGSNIWFPMTEGENWLQPRGRRVERVTYGGQPREVRHTHVDVNREIVPVNLAEHSGSLYDDLHHEDYFPHDEHEQVHTFFEDLSDFFPNGERQFPMPMNLQYEGDEGSNIWFPMTEGENWLQPRGRRVERVTYGGQPREVRHTHVDVNREIVPVNLHNDGEALVDHSPRISYHGRVEEPVTRYRVSRDSREVTQVHDDHFDEAIVNHYQPRTAHNLHAHGPVGEVTEDHFDTPIVNHYQPRTAHNLQEHSGSLYDDLHHEDYFIHDEHEQVHTFFEDLSDFFPNGERQFPMPMNLQYEGDEGSNIWFPMTEGENWLQPRGRRVERVTYGGQPREVRHTHVDVNREIVPVNLQSSYQPRTRYSTRTQTAQTADHFNTPLVEHHQISYDGHGAHGTSTPPATPTITPSTSTEETVLILDEEVFVDHEGTHLHGSGGSIIGGTETTTPTTVPTAPEPQPVQREPRRVGGPGTYPARPSRPNTGARTPRRTPITPAEPSAPATPTTPTTPTEPAGPTTPEAPATPTTLNTGSAVGSDLACHIIASDFTLFELHTMNKASGFYTQNGLSWNICQYLAGKEYFASNNGQDLTGPDYIPSKTDTVKDGDNIVGVSITRTSESVCRTEADGTEVEYQFTTIVKCDASITGEGDGAIQSVDSSDSCHPVVTMAHADGCYEYTANSLVRWLSENPTVLGIAFLLVGPIIAMCGKRWFPYIAAGIGAISMTSFIVLLAGIFGAFSSVVWGVLSVIVALAVGIAFGALLRRMVWTAVGITGAISGFLFGGFVYTLILQAFNWHSVWGYWGLAVTFAILFTALSCKFGQHMVLIATSFFGSYLFVQGLNYVFGGSVGLVTMIEKIGDGENVVFTASTYIYLVVFVCMFAFTTVWQAYKEEEHEELAKHTQKEGQFGRV